MSNNLQSKLQRVLARGGRLRRPVSVCRLVHVLERGVPRHEYRLVLKRDVDRDLFERTQLLLHEVIYKVFDAWQAMLQVKRIADYRLQAYFRLRFANPLDPIIIYVLGIEFDSHFCAEAVYDGFHEDRDAELLAPVNEDHCVASHNYRTLNLVGEVHEHLILGVIT